MSRLATAIITVVVILGSFAACAGAEYRIVINIPAFRLWLYQDGIPLKSYPISIGTELNPSVLGETKIVNKVVNPTYYPPNAAARGLAPIPPGPNNPVGTRWLGLGFAGYGIHGTNNPNSIGSAASSGCIRMLNWDVEELSALVQIGTIVQLIYRTVLVEEDPLLGTRMVTVYPDVYKQGSSLGQLEEELQDRGWDKVYWPALLGILEEPAGSAQLLPTELAVHLNGSRLEIAAVEAGGHSYMPIEAPLCLPERLRGETVQWGEEYFLPLPAYLELTGLKCEKAQGTLALTGPRAYLGRSYLGKALVYQGEVFIAAKGHGCQIIPEQLSALTFRGDVYFPAEHFVPAESLLELRLEWDHFD